MKEIDVEKIMSEIRADIKAKIIEKQKSIEIELNNLFSFLNSNWKISPFCTIHGKGLKLFIKKTIRKIVRPSFVQNFDSQKQFNEKVTQALIQMNLYIKQLELKIKTLEEGRQ